MRQLVVVSGKGGAGKTTVAAALGALAARESPVVLVDADVDASNLELLLAPNLVEEKPFWAGQVAVIDPDECQGCGICWSLCRFDAVEPPPEADLAGEYRIDATACEGCAACMHACPFEAIRMEPVQAGLRLRSDSRLGPLFHARLFAGRENSGKLVTAVRRSARELATKRGDALVLIDGPPGIGCPLIAAISGADLALVVTEPTVSGAHDLGRVLGVAEYFGVPAAVVINKADLNPPRVRAIESTCRDRGVPLAGRLPYDERILESTVRCQTLIEYDGGSLTGAVTRIWQRLRKLLPEATAALRVVRGSSR